MKNYLLNRMREASTWRGMVAMITALGVALSPDQQTAVISLGMAIVGALGVFLPDQKA
jgi:hypothetical protein